VNGRWQIVSKRYWPHSRIEGDQRWNFDAGWSAVIDEKIEMLRASDDQTGLLYELFLGYRFAEALELARALTSKSNASAWTWEMRGTTALLMGQADEAEASYAEAIKLRAAEDP
jgi:Flp pilus assembly protein TadD